MINFTHAEWILLALASMLSDVGFQFKTLLLIRLVKLEEAHERLRQVSQELAWVYENAVLFLPLLLWAGLVLYQEEG